ncbi:ATP-dependent DNA helicase PIF1 [Auxenochlorella protothecoides]|uniref:ATP-dependent DNA helicase n=1 Tax=Auxenochlorella protothecoides TaxID=3075 RepID=A0A087SBZ1_AUXPR|nr:ATP-dependent DNA helicase PIF1 [Auxenochlorella protothecoides]KFM23245.1 ATP-dependent DNA helicase PIF1 [Auxenochlorella protothecoides]
MRFTAKVKVEQGDASGSFVAAQPPKETMVELCRDACGLHTLVLHTKPRPLALPCKAPLVLYGGSAAQGRLGMRFLAVKTEAWRSVPRCVQLTLTSADAAALCGLRDRLHACLGGGPVKASGHVPVPTGSKTSAQPPRRPLAARDLNVTVSEPRPAPSLASTCFFGGGQVKPRPAASGSRPASSAVSSGSRRSVASRPCQGVTDLSPEQQRAVALVRAGKNVFFTGCAGTGKSRLLAAIMSVLPPSTTFVTASTGLAACALGGTTIHAFAGVGRAEGGIDAMAARAGLGESAQRWRRAAALIIDELPPVTRGSGRRAFCFQSPAWERCVQASVVLSRVYRQAGDEGFIALLGRLRVGAATAAELEELQRRCAPRAGPADAPDPAPGTGAFAPPPPAVLSTHLFTHRADVDAA